MQLLMTPIKIIFKKNILKYIIFYKLRVYNCKLHNYTGVIKQVFFPLKNLLHNKRTNLKTSLWYKEYKYIPYITNYMAVRKKSKYILILAYLAELHFFGFQSTVPNIISNCSHT